MTKAGKKNMTKLNFFRMYKERYKQKGSMT